MLPLIILTFSTAAAAFHQNAAELFPRQTVDKEDPCYTKMSSAYDSQPTFPAVYRDWTSSIFASATNNCTGFAVTGTVLSAWNSWRDEVREWSTSHSSEVASFKSECSSYLKSREDALQVSVSSAKESCRAKTSSPASTSVSETAGTSETVSTTTVPTETATSATSSAVASTTAAPDSAASMLLTHQGLFSPMIFSCMVFALAALGSM